MREPDGLWHKLYTMCFYMVLWELDTLLTFFYYKLLLQGEVKVIDATTENIFTNIIHK